MKVVQWSLAHLSGVGLKRAHDLMFGRGLMGLKSLHSKCGLPQSCYGLLMAACDVVKDAKEEGIALDPESFGRRLIEALMTRYENMQTVERSKNLEFIGRYAEDRVRKIAKRLRAGIDIGKSLGANFVLMNLQYVPAVVALPDEEEYARVMADVAKEKGAGLFRRFEIMRAWYKDGMPYSQFVTSDGLHLNDFGQKCIGKLLSMAIIDTIAPKQLTGAPAKPH